MEKPNVFIIRGLPASITYAQIEAAFSEAQIDFRKVERHETGYTRSSRVASELWRVSVAREVTLKQMRTISGILNVKVKIEPLVKKSVMQCKNCQEFFHSAVCCNHPYRCVKCIEQHLPGLCNRNKNKGLPPKCCNCGGEHPANDLQHCSYFMKKIKPIIDKRNTNQNKNTKINENVKRKTTRTFQLCQKMLMECKYRTAMWSRKTTKFKLQRLKTNQRAPRLAIFQTSTTK